MKEFLLIAAAVVYLRYLGLWIISKLDRMV